MLFYTDLTAAAPKADTKVWIQEIKQRGQHMVALLFSPKHIQKRNSSSTQQLPFSLWWLHEALELFLKMQSGCSHHFFFSKRWLKPSPQIPAEKGSFCWEYPIHRTSLKAFLLALVVLPKQNFYPSPMEIDFQSTWMQKLALATVMLNLMWKLIVRQRIGIRKKQKTF